MLRTAIVLLAIVTIVPESSAADGWLTVGAPGNMPDITGRGAVAYEFQIQRCEVTVREYAEFLNCVAKQSDPHQLWVPAMGEHVITDLGQGGIRKDVPQCILRVRANDEWRYEPVVERIDCPVFLVSFFSALRYANWLHNGRRQYQTETGAYDLSFGALVERSADAEVWLPNEDEWYKAAYFQPAEQGQPQATYWRYPVSLEQLPVSAEPGSELPHAACFSRGFAGIVPVGSYPNAKSPWGAYDMGGNVWEWTETPIYDSKRVLRGGASPHKVEKLRSDVRSNASPDRWYPDTGFRLARRVPK